ncbi:MAG: tRNA (adenosine(37)-N6)-threonylcarbamoyltransferase complex transferase subunit TsaD [Clostridia bacterium]|nr:tRNA (adenosine(37)-N6)-threonylcarbamoyltransferase complex transferase subunit TsaD [Clostridia bacterium]MBR2288504.1 tRNA (adenosine(37)-N6)-threonylcarbamoyltransferase complex transferase subunit TsaD [Clostridia bacterium]
MREKTEALRSQEKVRILSLETSCDETAAAIIENGRIIRANIVFSQIDLHALYGGVVPEIASRAHVEACDRVIDEALREADMSFDNIDALAVTCGPGLVGALLTGVSCMKGLSYALDKPLIPVNHIEGHISANFLTHPELEPPFLCLVVSGGHSHLVNVPDYGVYELIGQTMDDAAGEAFDKAARVLSLPYPGGPKLDQLAEEGNPEYLKLPHPHVEGYDYSFSGMKTAFLNSCHTMEMKGEELPKADLAASFRKAVVDSLVGKAKLAAKDTGAKKMAMAGGVSANRLLRREMQAACDSLGIPLYMPEIKLCTDNGAMIGSAAYYRLLRGETAALTLNAMPSLRLV